MLLISTEQGHFIPQEAKLQDLCGRALALQQDRTLLWDRDANWETPALPSETARQSSTKHYAFLYKREALHSLSGSTQSNRYAKILALKSLKIWCSLSINNHRLPALLSCTSTFPKHSYADPPMPTLSPALCLDRHANKKASCHGIFPPYRQMSIKNQVSLRFASRSSFQLLLPAREEFPLCPFTSDGSMRFGINPRGLEGNCYRTGTGTLKGQV